MAGPGFKRLMAARGSRAVVGNTVKLQALAREVAAMAIQEEALAKSNSNGRHDTRLYVLRKRLDAARINLRKLEKQK